MKRILSSQNIKYTKDLNLEELKKTYNREQFIEAVCEDCGNIFTRRLRFFSTPLCANCSKKHTALEHYGVANISQAKEIKEKKKKTFDNKSAEEKQAIIEKKRQTSLRKYGVTSYFKTPEFRKRMTENNPGATKEAIEKRRQTMLQKYGVENAYQSEEIKQKLKEIFLNKYGVEYPTQIKEIKDKVAATNIERYGVDNPMKVGEFATAARNTSEINAQKYAEENDLLLVRDLKENYKGHWVEKVDLIHHNGLTFIKKEDLKKVEDYCEINIFKGTSHKEKEIVDFVRSFYDGEIIENSRKIIAPKELDIFIPEKNVAIEFDGLFWHSELNVTNKNYHLEKTKKCEEKNIRLIHIFEDEWMNKQDIIKSIIKSSLGVYDRKYNARDLMFKKVGSKEAKSFLENNHIQGFCSASQHFGLYDNDRLVQCISIGLNRFSKERNLELIRMCTQLNTQVVGGFSKLIKNMFKQTGASLIESYVDRRLFSHSGYLSSGWKVDRESKPSYFYTDGKKRFNRQSFMKKRCLSLWPESDASKTEHQLCLEHGLFQIYDCGTVKMEYEQN